MFSLEDDFDIQTISNASAFLWDTLNIWDNDGALVYFIRRKTIACLWLHYGVNKFFWIFIKHEILSYVLNFVVEILLAPTYVTLALLSKL
jgi:hypothetical protein